MPTLINSAMPQTIKVGITFCLSGRLRRTKKPSKKVPTAHTYSPPVSVIQKTQTINNSQRTPLRNSYVLFFEAGIPVGGRGKAPEGGIKKRGTPRVPVGILRHPLCCSKSLFFDKHYAVCTRSYMNTDGSAKLKSWSGCDAGSGKFFF